MCRSLDGSVSLLLGQVQGVVDDVVQQTGFSGTGDSCDRNNHAQGYREVDGFEIVSARAVDFDLLPSGLAASVGKRNSQFFRKIPASERSGHTLNLIVGPRSYERATVFTGTGTEV